MKKILSKNRGKRKDKTFSILSKAWHVQSMGLRRIGTCAGCGSKKNIVSGHLCHSGRGKAFNKIDFNVLLPCDNIFPQCSFCNTYDPDGNGKLRAYFNRKYFNADDLYENLRMMKLQVLK